jgi:SIR2-like domain
MAHILLTGAGFSRNWGGWLADEVFEYLLGDPDITPGIRTQLFRDRSSGGNYETTVQALRDRAKAGDDADFQVIISILSGMFNAMNNAFSRQGFAFDHTNDMRYQLSKFMHRFDWIFTLNQDTLLERHYFTHGFNLSSQNRWNGYDIPGLEMINAQNNGMPVNASTLFVAKQTGFQLQRGGYQPYIKLHGSSNWMASRTAGLLLITGGLKETDINDSPLLAWYSGLFRQAITDPSAKIMIVGYGFGDEHINKMLVEAARAGAKFFIVDLIGADILHRPATASTLAPCTT